MKRAIWLLIIGLCALSSSAQHLTRPKAKVAQPPVLVEKAQVDTLAPDDVRISGYDKPLRARRESMIVTNCGTQPFDSVALTLTYCDNRGTVLNTRKITISAPLAPGQAKAVSIRSWDVNNSYYYFLTPPTRAAGSPFRLSVSALPIRCK